MNYLGSGWEFDVYLTADGWVFRFPMRAEYSSVFKREKSVHALVEPVLALCVTIPRVQLLGVPGPDFPYPFAGHWLVPGLRADDPQAPVSHSLATEVGSSALRRLPILTKALYGSSTTTFVRIICLLTATQVAWSASSTGPTPLWAIPFWISRSW